MRALWLNLGGLALLLTIAADHVASGERVASMSPCELAERNAGRMPSDCGRSDRVASRVSRGEAEAILDQVDFPLEPIVLAEITENGNMVIAGKAELLVIRCPGDETVHIADLTLGSDAPKPEALSNRIGSRCSSTVLANQERPARGPTGCTTFVCFADSDIYERAHPEE